jgi:hypothetical protein
MSYGSTLEKYLTKPGTSEKAFSPEGKTGGLVKSASDKWKGGQGQPWEDHVRFCLDFDRKDSIHIIKQFKQRSERITPDCCAED